MNITSLDHVGLRVTDRDRAVSFYARLGFELEPGEDSPEHCAIGLITATGVRLNLIYNGQDHPDGNVLLDGSVNWPGWTHAAFIVDDLDALMAAFETRGIPLSGGPDVYGEGRRRVCFIRDPDRNVLEFNQLLTPMSSAPLTLYASPLSGHSHRAELMLNLLGLPYEVETVDLRAKHQKNQTFLALNPFGVVPVLKHGDRVISDSIAILIYLASTFDTGRQWSPSAPLAAAEVQSWLSVAQGPLYRGPHLARLSKAFGFPIDGDAARSAAADLLTVMNAHLARQTWLVGDGPTIADVANYSYIALAPQGGVDLSPYPAIGRWLAAVEALEGFVAAPSPAEVQS